MLKNDTVPPKIWCYLISPTPMKIQWLDQQTYVKQLAEHTQKLYLWCKIIINVESSALVLVCNNHHNNDTIFATLLIYTLHSSEITELHAHSPGLSFRPAERPEDHPDHSPQNPGQVTTQWVRTSSGHTYNSSKYIKTKLPMWEHFEARGPWALSPAYTYQLRGLWKLAVLLMPQLPPVWQGKWYISEC